MVKVGVTGGIGSGKSTVCAVWESMGAVVVYSDTLAKKLMETEEELISAIREKFGDEAYHEDGTLNRGFLSAQAFQKGRVGELNRIVHPAVRRKIGELMERAEAQGAEMFVEEAALLLDRGRPDHIDYVVLVHAGRDRRIRWIEQRDGADRNEILSRMKKQRAHEELMPMADFVLENSGSLQSLKQKASELYWKLLKLQNAGID